MQELEPRQQDRGEKLSVRRITKTQVIISVGALAADIVLDLFIRDGNTIFFGALGVIGIAYLSDNIEQGMDKLTHMFVPSDAQTVTADVARVVDTVLPDEQTPYADQRPHIKLMRIFFIDKLMGIEGCRERMQLPSDEQVNAHLQKMMRESQEQIRPQEIHSIEKMQQEVTMPDQTLHLGPTLQPHADSILSKRIGIFGIPGSGKSNALTVFIEEIGKFRNIGVPFVLADTEDEYGALFSPTYLMRPYKAGSHNVIPENAYDFGLQVMERGLQVILNLQSYENDDGAALVMVEIIRGLRTFAEERTNDDRATCMFIIDETAYWLPQSVRESSLSREKDGAGLTVLDRLQHAVFRTVVRRGRKRGIGFLFATQRPADLDNRCISCDWLMLFRQTLPADLAVYDKMGVPKDVAPALAQGQAYVIDPHGDGAIDQFRRRHSPDNSKSPGIASLEKYAARWGNALSNTDLRSHQECNERQSCERSTAQPPNAMDHAQNVPTQDGRCDRRIEDEGAREADVDGQMVDALPPGWTQEHVKMLPFLYKACGNLDTCLTTMEISKYQRNRDFAREILKKQGLWKEK